MAEPFLKVSGIGLLTNGVASFVNRGDLPGYQASTWSIDTATGRLSTVNYSLGLGSAANSLFLK
jgi:hypothetical protein